jgi:hypothetical protein
MSDNVELVSVPESLVSLDVEPVSVREESISLTDIQNDRDVIFQREQTMKTVLTDALLNWSVSSIKPKLVEWALQGYPVNYEIVRVDVDLLPVCSDGVSRGIHQFVEYCIGCTLSDVITKFYSKLSGFSIAYTYTSNSISICVIKV